jgi:hypothetical protein
MREYAEALPERVRNALASPAEGEKVSFVMEITVSDTSELLAEMNRIGAMREGDL